MRPFLLAILLPLLATQAVADQQALPLAKRVSIEKVRLAERYQQQVQQCRGEKRKAVRERCQAKRKAELDEQLTALHDNPRAYFQNQERQGNDQEMVRQSARGD